MSYTNCFRKVILNHKLIEEFLFKLMFSTDKMIMTSEISACLAQGPIGNI